MKFPVFSKQFDKQETLKLESLDLGYVQESVFRAFEKMKRKTMYLIIFTSFKFVFFEMYPLRLFKNQIYLRI